MKVKSLSRVRPSATPWTAAYQAPLSMGFSRQEYWSGVPLPSPTHPTTPTLTSKHPLNTPSVLHPQTLHLQISLLEMFFLPMRDLLPVTKQSPLMPPPYYRALYTTKNNNDNTTSPQFLPTFTLFLTYLVLTSSIFTPSVTHYIFVYIFSSFPIKR